MPGTRFALPQWATNFRAFLVKLASGPVLYVTNHIGKLFCIFVFLLSLLHQVLWNLDIVFLKEALRMLVNFLGKRNKMKQEEDELWLESILRELSDEDDPDDHSYQPTKSETDSEEYKSQNDTDLEVEERNELLMLLEHPKEGLKEEDEGTAGIPNSGARGGELLELHTSGDVHEDPQQLVVSRTDNGTETPRVGCQMTSIPGTIQDLLTGPGAAVDRSVSDLNI